MKAAGRAAEPSWKGTVLNRSIPYSLAQDSRVQAHSTCFSYSNTQNFPLQVFEVSVVILSRKQENHHQINSYEDSTEHCQLLITWIKWVGCHLEQMQLRISRVLLRGSQILHLWRGWDTFFQKCSLTIQAEITPLAPLLFPLLPPFARGSIRMPW